MGSLPIFLHRRASAILAALTLLAVVCPADAAVLGVEGRVVLRESPVSEARVYAYQLVEKSLHKVLTDASGRFLFESLPAGIYKLIAHKAGLAPAVVLLQRDAAETAQFVELELTEESAADSADFWSVRSEIPGDVLREINGPATGEATADPQVADLVVGTGTGAGSQMSSSLLTEVAASSGIHDVTPEASALVTGANVGLKGQLGRVKLSMQGDFQTFVSDLQAPAAASLGLDGKTQSVSLNLKTPGSGDFDISTSSNRLSAADEGVATPVEASQLFFRWNRPLGDSGTTTVKASLIEENGLYNRAWADPIGVPTSSRTLRLEGDYARKIADNDLRAGLRYRESTGAYTSSFRGNESALPTTQSIDAFADGGWQTNSKVLVQYGLFSTLSNGSLSITPRGGFVLQMGPHWQSSLAAAHRVVSQRDLATDEVLPMFVDSMLTCGEAESYCYQLDVARSSGADDQFSLGASYRELDDTIRMYFNGNFFESSEGIFLVSGDQLPEVHAALRQRLAPGIVAKFSASAAEGGGGVFRSVNRRYYENQVSMLSSSIDTRFEHTSTGVYLSFHRLDQELQPLRRGRAAGAAPATNLERLDLVISQDLSAIWDLSLDWAVQLGMGIARGASFAHSDVDSNAIQRRVVTGVAVRF